MHLPSINDVICPPKMHFVCICPDMTSPAITEHCSNTLLLSSMSGAEPHERVVVVFASASPGFASHGCGRRRHSSCHRLHVTLQQLHLSPYRYPLLANGASTGLSSICICHFGVRVDESALSITHHAWDREHIRIGLDIMDFNLFVFHLSHRQTRKHCCCCWDPYQVILLKYPFHHARIFDTIGDSLCKLNQD